MVDHLDARLPAVGDEVVAGLLLHSLLLLEQVSEQGDGKLQNGMVGFLVIEIFYEH